MADPKQLEILKMGAKKWNKWRWANRANPHLKIDLDGADLRHADIPGAYLVRADLNGANLVGANLTRSDLYEANLSGANFVRANLFQANLSKAYLWRSNFGRANLSESKLSMAKCWVTFFSANDLSEVIDLNKVEHGGPSTIGIDTLRLSKGKIPEFFLRGCGLSDWEIESAKLYTPDLSNEEIINIQNRIFEIRARQPLQISSLFISYSHEDNQFVDKLESYLTEKGIRFWRDVHDLKAGRLEKQIDRAMRLNPTVLLVLSKDSIQSDWVEHEVKSARGLEKELGRDVLCPVTLDEFWKEPMGTWSQVLMDQVKKYHILDFSKWKDEVVFNSMFGRLVEGLDLFYKN